MMLSIFIYILCNFILFLCVSAKIQPFLMSRLSCSLILDYLKEDLSKRLYAPEKEQHLQPLPDPIRVRQCTLDSNSDEASQFGR